MNNKGSKTKVGQDKSELVAKLPMACADERSAIEFFEKQRWGDTPCCPECGDTDVYQMKDRDGNRQKNCRWRCRGCGKQYTWRTGTVMEDSRIPAHNWAYGFWRAATSKKGVSALEIKRHTGLSYKSALFLMHRIRFAMAPTDGGPKLTGTVEADETFVGGKPRKRTPQKPFGKPGQEPSNAQTMKDRKTPVFGVVSRETGEVRARVLPDVKAHNLKAACDELIDKSAKLMTDEAMAYRTIGKAYAGHETVTHGRGEYVRGDVTTNTIEGFWSLLKRGVYGTFHNVSRAHLQRYVDELEFRYNHRKLEDGQRTLAAIAGGEGKRLMYCDPI
ncbi:IS1595 family transposase [Algisphaera agarilytica]|uniref:Transposase-like protein n=1 Tax=Algisphaera agarilytica TaxID=1385975 RepID=A0A7X0H5F5_9BACT|nr:IS1595 family transposase [Algisphaera agarilytica]MBB6428466.1 transposase-like protein [Algisphaera agarilytica]